MGHIFRLVENKKAGETAGLPQSRIERCSVARNHRAAAEAEAVVNTDLEGVLVEAEVAERHQRPRADEVGAAEIVIHVLALGRPVRGEHVFEAGADSVAVAMVAIEDEGDRDTGEGQRVAVVGIGVTAFDVDQARTPGVAEAAGDRADPALVAGVDEAAGEGRVEAAIAEPAILAFQAEHPARRELPVGANLQAAEDAGAVIAEHEAAEIVAAVEGAADMAADIEAGPVIDRRRVGGGLLVVAAAEIGAEGRRGGADGREGRKGEQDLLHVLGLRKTVSATGCGPPSKATQIDGFRLKCCHFGETAAGNPTHWRTNDSCT
jgi:hypothetical protein